MKTIKGPGLFLAQFKGTTPPFNNLDTIAGWAASLGFRGVQLPTGTRGFVDLEQAASSQGYCDDIREMLAEQRLELTELSSHMQGQLIACHPAYDALFDDFATPELRGRPQARQQWATRQLLLAARASLRFGLKAHVTFSGALAWPYFYPWPQRLPGLIAEAFAELGRRWLPILDAFEDVGVDYDPSHLLLQHLDYLEFIDIYHERIKAFHVKDAEYRPNGRSGVYGGYQSWIDRPGRFRSVGDGQIDFSAVFAKLAYHDFPNWAVLEWECCLKHPEVGAREGAAFIRNHIITVTDRAFDDFASSVIDSELNRRILGL